jgi:hypothetical protein
VPNTFSDPYIQFAFDIGVVAVALTLVLVTIIIRLRLSLRRSQRLEQAFLEVWRPLLLESISSPDTPDLPPLPASSQVYFLKLWNYLQESLRGTANARLNELALKLHCDTAARSLLEKGNRAERLLAILTLAHLRDRASWDALVVQAAQHDSLASIHAARALINIDPIEGTRLMLPMLLRRQDWDIARLANFLGPAVQAFWLHLSKNILRIDKALWGRALQLADALKLQLPVASMHYIMEQCDSSETLVTAIRQTTEPALLPLVRSHLRHSDWRVRVEAAGFMGRFGDTQDAAALQAGLEDPQWWVRYAAAQALASMPFFGTAQLLELRARTHSSDALAMLDHVLAEHRFAPS